MRELLFEIAVVAHKRGATARVYSRWHIREAFGELGKTKDTIAKAVAESLPALKPWLPPPRRIWESEHYSMAIFEAAALGVTHYRRVGAVEIGARESDKTRRCSIDVPDAALEVSPAAGSI